MYHVLINNTVYSLTAKELRQAQKTSVVVFIL